LDPDSVGSVDLDPDAEYCTCLGTDILKGTVSRDFLLLIFFRESVSPQPQSVPLGPFQIFSKICGDIRKSRCTTGINDTGGKFATGVQHRRQNCRRYQRHWRQICHLYQRHRRQILPPVSLVLLIPVANNGNNIRLLRA
jgi:hypothetical protein